MLATVFFKFYLFIILAVVDLHCCVRAFSGCSEWGCALVSVHRLLTVLASLVGHRLQGERASVVRVGGLSSHGAQP